MVQGRGHGDHRVRGLLGTLQRLRTVPPEPLNTLPFSSSRPPLGPGFPTAPPPSAPLIPTELIEGTQQLPGHDAASSAKVHGPTETGLVLAPEPFDIFNSNPPTASPIHHDICPALLGNFLPTLMEWLIPGVGRVEEGWLEESGWEDQHVFRY